MNDGIDFERFLQNYARRRVESSWSFLMFSVGRLEFEQCSQKFFVEKYES